jgi:uncharacterized protein (DUF608 family)
MPRKYKKGTRIVIKEDVSKRGHYYEHRGKRGKITDVSRWDSSVKEIELDNGVILRHVGYSVIDLEEEVEPDNPTKEQMINKINEYKNIIKEHEKKIKALKKKLNFMDEYDLNEFNESYYKAQTVLDKIEDSNATRQEKVKAIGDLFN